MRVEDDPESTVDNSSGEKALTFDDDPSLSPQNLSQARKALILTVAFVLVATSTTGSSLASGGASSTIDNFGLSDDYGWRVLPVFIYLVGYLIGNTVLAPLGERYGRRPVNLITEFGFVVFMMATGLAPNWATFNVFRLLDGFFTAGPASTIAGLCADLYVGEFDRGHALLGYQIATNFGSVLGPIIFGFAVFHSWQLPYWIGLAIEGVCFLCIVFFIPETNHKIILDKKARSLRTEKVEVEIYGPGEIEPASRKDMVSKVLIRPLVMLVTEPIIFFTCIYMAFQYALFYVFFQSYTIIFEDIYNLTTGEEGLAFIGFGIEVILTISAQYLVDYISHRAVSQDRPWKKHHGTKRLPPACASGPLIVLTLFWSAWTSRPSIDWISSALSGIPSGLAYTINFTALLNYLIDNYTQYASPANAASSQTRQLMGAALPFAATPMYRKLGVDWASSLLGFLAIDMSAIPFTFWIFGERMLKGSEWAQELIGTAEGRDVKGSLGVC